MKQSKINNAYQALQRLSAMQLPVIKAYGVYKLMKCFEESFQFELKFERDLLAKYGGVLEADGNIRFANVEDANSFQSEIEEANNMDVELAFTKLDLSDLPADTMKITADDIMCLEDIVVFVK